MTAARGSRVVPISERAVGWCEKYLLDSRPALVVPPEENRLFLSGVGGTFISRRLADIDRRHLRAAGIQKPGACHLFRHTCATLMLEGGADIRYIQDMLGHASLETTRLYTHVAIGALKAVHERCHPGAGHRPPRPIWPPQDHPHDPLGLDDDDLSGGGGLDDWDRIAAELLAALDDDEPDA